MSVTVAKLRRNLFELARLGFSEVHKLERQISIPETSHSKIKYLLF